MKKARFLFPFLAIIVGVSTALTTKPKQNCAMASQFYFNGVTYVYAGVLGTDYLCTSGPGWCTFTQGQTSYTPCQAGIYTSLKAAKKK